MRWNDVRGCYSYVLFYISSIPPLSFHPSYPLPPLSPVSPRPTRTHPLASPALAPFLRSTRTHSVAPLRPGLARTLTLRQMYKDKTGSIRDPLDVAREQNGSPPVRA